MLSVTPAQAHVISNSCRNITENHSNKNTQLDVTISRKIYCFVVQTLLNMFRALPCPSSGAHQTAVADSGFHMKPLHSYGNQRLRRQFDGFLMMGMVMPETC
jgi:hypothetical protein